VILAGPAPLDADRSVLDDVGLDLLRPDLAGAIRRAASYPRGPRARPPTPDLPVPRALPLLALALASVPTACVSPDPAPTTPRALEAGADLRVYPAGVISGAMVTSRLADDEVLVFSAGFNDTDREDFGEHDDETGGGPGVGIGYRRYWGGGLTGWMLGGRVDVWDLDVDWIDQPGMPGETRGNTDVLVIQPTLEGGYAWRLGADLRAEVFVAAGVEVNVDTDGEDVGEGGIGILGFSLLYGF
jgi:hypothetical protein